MADEELSKALKDLHYKVQTSSLKQRRSVVESVIGVLPNPGINEGIIKGICKVLVLTYQDTKTPVHSNMSKI
nr:unnamed protein product [Callosobruchus analis]